MGDYIPFLRWLDLQGCELAMKKYSRQSLQASSLGDAKWDSSKVQAKMQVASCKINEN